MTMNLPLMNKKMLIFILIVLFISLIINVLTSKIIYNSIKKIDFYEKWILDFKTRISASLNLMRDIDKQGTFATSINDKGNFESDDQVGQVFKEMIEIMNELEKKIQ